MNSTFGSCTHSCRIIYCSFSFFCSIVLGIAAQSILSNVVSGIALYTSPAFIVGDKVTLITTNGAIVVQGVVRIIAPTRTIIRANDGSMVYINNADLGKMLVKNESQTVALVP